MESEKGREEGDPQEERERGRERGRMIERYRETRGGSCLQGLLAFCVKTPGSQLCSLDAGGLREFAFRFKSSINRLEFSADVWAVMNKTGELVGELSQLHQRCAWCLRPAPSRLPAGHLPTMFPFPSSWWCWRRGLVSSTPTKQASHTPFLSFPSVSCLICMLFC